MPGPQNNSWNACVLETTARHIQLKAHSCDTAQCEPPAQRLETEWGSKKKRKWGHRIKRQQDQLKKQKQGVKAAACCRERSWARDRNKLLTFSCPCLSWGAEIRRASRLPPSSCWRRSSPPRGLSASPPPSSSPPGAFASAAQTCRAAEMEEGKGGDGQTGRGRREEIWGQTGKRKETRR